MSRPALVLKKFAVIASVAIREKFAYLASSTARYLTYGLFVFVFSRIWAAVYAGSANIAGYTREMSTWYFIVAELPIFSFSAFFARVSDELKNGQIAYRLARPYGFIPASFAERVGPALLDLAVFGAVGFALGFALAGPPPVPAGLALAVVPALVLSLVLSACLQFFLQMSLAMTAFRLEENDAFYWIYQKLALVVGTLMPIEFLPDAARAVARWTPFPAIAWSPARILVAFEPRAALSILGVQAAWVLAAALLSSAVFAAGRRHVIVNGG